MAPDLRTWLLQLGNDGAARNAAAACAERRAAEARVAAVARRFTPPAPLTPRRVNTTLTA
jgi:hypothetical protein